MAEMYVAIQFIPWYNSCINIDIVKSHYAKAQWVLDQQGRRT